MTSKIKYLFLALTPILTYNVINLLCALFVSSSILEDHYFAFDSIFCILILILFSFWISHLHISETEPSLAVVSSPDMMRKVPILTLGMNGISSLWFMLVVLGLQSIPLIADSLESFDNTWSTIEAEPYIWPLLSVVIVGPIVEELLFRGILFHYLEKVNTGWFPIIISGILFGLWHMEPVQVVYTTLMGIALGLIYAKTRNLKVTISLHMLNNFLSTLPPSLDTPFVQDIIFYASLLMVLPTLYILIQTARAKAESIEQQYTY